jgi:thioesterase domain-containing protein/acyl carrier protein
VTSESTTSTVESLIPIWKRVLQLEAVAVEDNFFDLGGDSSLALELFHEIALACGRELPPVMIYQAPTIAALAQVLEQPTAPRVPALVQLKAGAGKPPIFIAHGLGGSVMDFYQLVKHIETSHAIYGMQAKGIDGTEEPFDRIEDMARYFLEAIKQTQPRGPYYLVGFSLGGLVTLEMAQQLVAEGESVGLLALLDSYPHTSQLSLSQRTRLGIRQTWRKLAKKLDWIGIEPPFQTVIEIPPSQDLQHFRDSAYRALERYKPRFYPGELKFVRAAIPTDFPSDPSAVWSHLAQGFELKTVPGDHIGMMTTHFDRLAEVISGYLRQVSRR